MLLKTRGWISEEINRNNSNNLRCTCHRAMQSRTNILIYREIYVSSMVVGEGESDLEGEGRGGEGREG